jgi:hypothetical protein
MSNADGFVQADSEHGPERRPVASTDVEKLQAPHDVAVPAKSLGAGVSSLPANNLGIYGVANGDMSRRLPWRLVPLPPHSPLWR